MKNETNNAFDKLAERYDSWFDRHAPVFESEVHALKKIIPKAGEGLEVGVGSGRFAAALGIKTGVEPSATFRALAKSRGINVVEGFAESLPFSDKKFDFVLFCTVLCFLEDPLKALEEAKRVLKPNGAMIIGMLDKNSSLIHNYELRSDNPFYCNAHFYSVKEVLEFLHQIGFKEKEIYQTIFSDLENIKEIEEIKSGYGEGGFVTISAQANHI